MAQGGDAPTEAGKCSGSSKKRQRGEKTDSEAESKGEVDDDHRKQIVRIRAKVHCTAAGRPGLDAPASSGKGVHLGEDDASSLPEWHPLQKVC